MNSQEIRGLESCVQTQLNGRVLSFHLRESVGGLILQGRASCYYAKQLAQELVMKATDIPIHANDIEVS